MVLSLDFLTSKIHVRNIYGCKACVHSPKDVYTWGCACVYTCEYVSPFPSQVIANAFTAMHRILKNALPMMPGLITGKHSGGQNSLGSELCLP